MRDTILFGDCRETLKEFDEQARTCVTSPPYYIGLRDTKEKVAREENQIGQEQTPDDYHRSIKIRKTYFKEVRNVLTDDGTCWVNLGEEFIES